MLKFRISEDFEERYPKSFRMAPIGADWRLEVRVYPNRRAYLRGYHRMSPVADGARSWAATIWRFPDDYVFGRGEVVIGYILLDATMLSAEVITHEAFHAALQIHRWRNVGVADFGLNEADENGLPVSQFTHDLEEEAALSCGRLAGAIADGLFDAGVWEGSEGRLTDPRDVR